MSYFVWAFKKFIRQSSPFALSNALNISEKAVYSWATEEDSPFHRKSPLDRTVEVLDVFNRHTPELLYEVLTQIAERYGYRLEKLPKEEDVRLSTLLKELNDVPEELTRAYEDGQLTQEELQKAIQEIAQAQEVLAKKKAYLQWRLEQQKPINIRRRPA
uniref:Hypothetical conserved protein n=1 Tax=uncultured Aquificia bacterium TaxID=453415 RepID=H5SBU5_9BACT|nr:hypothetical conserved protein [uncultured Aquificae bacterium]